MLVYGLDKLLAVLKWRRISERTLLRLSLIGGGVGGLSGMLLFNHKTNNARFWALNLVSAPIWFGLYYFAKRSGII